MPAIPTLTAASLLSMLGMNTHLNFGDTRAYARESWPTIEADLAYLGVRYVRDGTPVDHFTLPEYLRLAHQGVRFDVVPGVNFEKDIPAGIDTLAREVKGSIAAVEGPNEINMYEAHFAGLHSMKETGHFARAVQPALYAQVHADPNLKGVAVYNLTLGIDTPELVESLGDMTAMADAANWHPYAGRFPPATNLRKGAAKALGIVRDKQLVFTEAGYCGDIVGSWCSVTRAQQTAWTLDLFLDSASMGARVYVYELTDHNPRASNTDAENGFGMFDADGKPYPVAVALHNFHQIVADRGTPAKVTPVDATITGEAQTLGVDRSDGSSQLILWNDSGSIPVTVTLPARHARLAVYDPTVGTEPVASLANTATAHLTVTDHPLILSIGPAR